MNRLCLAAGVTLVESGSAGYLGQVSVIRKVRRLLSAGGNTSTVQVHVYMYMNMFSRKQGKAIHPR